MNESGISNLIAEYIDARAQAKLEKFDKEEEKQRKELSDDELAEFELATATKREEEIDS